MNGVVPAAPDRSTGGPLDRGSEATRRQRAASLHALEVLEYAVHAPAPRRLRTWMHRVAIAADALAAALEAERRADDGNVGLLTEIALTDPAQVPRVEELRRQLLDLRVAVAGLRERIEPDPLLTPDPETLRDHLTCIAREFHRHQADEAALIRDATGLDMSAPAS